MILAEPSAPRSSRSSSRSGDETRTFEPNVEKDGATESAYYFAVNRSKQSITVNLRSPDGQAVIRDLARGADVLIENFPVGTLADGLDYAAVRAVNEQLVYVSCTGFGQSGPDKCAPQGLRHRLPGDGRDHEPHRRARRRAGQARAAGGRPHLRAVGRDFDPRRAGGPRRDGGGSYVDFSMIDGQVALLTLAAARYFALGEVPPRLGTEHPGRVPSA